MRILLVFCIATLCMANTAFEANGMIVPGATEAGIRNDCQVTAEMSVMLLKMKAKTGPDQLLQNAAKMLATRDYKGSFGDMSFVAQIYTGLALQMGGAVDQFMASATPEDLENMEKEHEISCLEKALEELQGNRSNHPPQ
jgi:hypothetical protein